MMGKQKARKLVDAGELSIGDLRAMINAKRGHGGQSYLNKTFSVEEILDIFESGVEGRDDDEVPAMWAPDPYSTTGRMKRTRDHLYFSNVVRECG